MFIQTVLGPIDPETLGITQTHEHLLIDSSPLAEDPYDAIVYDEEMVIEELGLFKAAGGNCIVDVTTIDLARDPEALRRISQATGLHIVMGTGWYRPRVYPPYIWEKSTNELADIIIREVTQGVGDTGIRAGIIGEIGTERHHIRPETERVFRAAARAHLQCGAAITTHTTHFGELAMQQLDLLEEEGVNLSRVIVGHLGDRRGVHHLLPIAERGAFVQIDNIGCPYQRQEERVKNVVGLIQRGYVGQILLSLDVYLNSMMHYFGGPGYDYLLTTFVPMLQQAGVSQRELDIMLIENPRRALAFG